jgi:hypothetical protein
MKKKEISKIPLNKRIQMAGIKMIGKYPDDPQQYLEYNGKKLVRPHANKAEAFCKKEFGLTI